MCTERESIKASLTYARLIRYAAIHRCTDFRRYDEAEAALEGLSGGELDKLISELAVLKRQCECTSCLARRLLAATED